MRLIVESLSRFAPSLVMAALAVPSCVLAGCAGPDPATPPLLANVSAGGGLWGACPARSSDEARVQEGRPSAISPELQKRLEENFPPGTAQTKLVDTLQSQGFKLLSSCSGDPSIRIARFTRQGGGLTDLPMTAEVYWKVNEAKEIVWTKGFVRYVAV
jgi:hypothetical protein